MSAQYANSLQQSYKKIATAYATKRDHDVNEETLIPFVKQLPAGAQILDLGCGNGRDSEWFVSQGMSPTMFDLSTELLEIAHRRVPQARAVQGDMTELPFVDSSFDGVWANASLLHLTKHEAVSVLRKIKKILRPGGILYLGMKKGSGEVVVIDTKYGEGVERFFSLYEPQELSDMVKTAGFIVHSLKERVSGSGTAWVDVLCST